MNAKRSLCIILLVAAAAFAQQQALTPEMVVGLKSAGNVTLDPTGRNVAYTVSAPRGVDEEPGGNYSELFVISASGPAGSERQFTRRPANVSSVQWSPDGKVIYFLSKRKEFNEQNQVYRIAVDGGEAQIVTRAGNGVRQFRLSPDGAWLAYTMTDAATDVEKKAVKIGDDERVVDRNFKHHRLYVQPVNESEAKALTGEMTVWEFEWSPESRHLVFQASPTPRTDDSYMFKKIYVIAREGQGMNGMPLTETKGKLGHMAWSPDGLQIAFLAGVDEADPTSGSIFVVPATGGAARNLTPDFEGTVNWTGWVNAATLAFIATEKSHTTFNILSPVVGMASLKRIISSGYGFNSASFSADGKTFAMAMSSFKHPSEVFAGKMVTGKTVRLTISNPELESLRLSGNEETSWTARDGLTITGLLMKPLDYQPGKNYPCLVYVHGGPESAVVEGWTTSYGQWGEMAAARGYVVFSPNYRGSTGRGVAYSKADHQDLAGKEFDDVIDGIDHLIAQGLVDGQRVGIGGGSYGGYFSAWAATKHSARFAAASMFAGIANWVSFTGTSDIPYENSMVHWNMPVFENMEKAWSRSPMAHIKNSQTALLITHGDKDDRVPIGQGWEIYTGMKMLGKNVEFVIYPREPHGLLERNHRLDFATRTLDWFDKYVKQENSTSPSVPVTPAPRP
jgi:dipeptidyl aminopeptidase/acylaminoacyl peptidase